MFGHQYPGKYIVFEGGEGSGKTTQQGLLVEKLKFEYPKTKIVLTREPGGTPKSEEIRRVIFGVTEEGEHALPVTEVYLFAAVRHQNIERTIKPALERGMTVVADRCFLSSLVYQGIVKDLGWQKIWKLNQEALGGVLPDLIILPDIDPEIGLARKRGRTDINRFDEEKLEFHQKVREGYLFFAERLKGSGGLLKIDGSLPIETQSGLIWDRVNKLITDKELTREFSIRRESE